MEAWLVAIAAVIALAVLGVVELRERRTLRAIRGAAAIPVSGDPVAAVRVLAARAERLDAARAREAHDRTEFVDGLSQGVLTLSDDGRIVGANTAAGRLLDRAPGTMLGRTPLEVFIDTRVEAISNTALEVGSASGEVEVAGADGPKLVIRARRAPAGGLWLVMEDVSELRRLQQIRTEFIDNLSHELRTPLTTVSLLAETLTRDAEAAGDAVPARMRDRIGKIEIETGHLVQMVSELLDLSRIESGTALGALELLDLGQVANESVERLRLFADRQGVAVRVERAPSLPPVRGDGDRLGQVFVNLLHNAVKFSPDGGDVDLAVSASGSDVVVAIADHGVGVPRAAQARIFERFYKVDRARVRGETGGTGLGLAIARHIIEQHGGRIWVDSREGVGSTFSFSLPIAPPASFAAGAPPA